MRRMEQRSFIWGNGDNAERRPAMWGQQLCVAATRHMGVAAMRSGDLPCGGGSYAERRPATIAITITITISILARFRDLA